MKLALIVACAALFVTTARADENLWKVYHTPNDSITDCTLDSLAGDQLYVTSHGVPFAVPVDSVTRLRFERRAELGGSIGKGMLIGFAAGSLLTVATYHESGGQFEVLPQGPAILLGSIGCAYMGGLVGLASGLINAVDQRFDLHALSSKEKRERLSSLIGH